MRYVIQLYILCVLVLGGRCFGQEKAKVSDKKFDNYWYVEAARQYEAAVKKGDISKETLQKLGDSYFFNTNMEKAAKWYGKLFSNYENELRPVYAFRYIQALEGTGNYHLAKALMKIYSEKITDTTFYVSQLHDNDLDLDRLRNKQPQFYVTPLSINTRLSDFGAAFYKNQVVFASTRDSSNLKTRKYQWNDQPYLNLFLADTVLQGSDLKNVTSFSKTINTKYHEASVVFNKTNDTVYFTRNNYHKKLKRNENGINNLKIYRAVKSGDNKWGNITELPFCSDDYSVGHPALTTDGTKLYFTSDMPGTIGGPDLFVVDINTDGSFSEPKNLGDKINTSGREMFSFVTDKKLYFASDGHLGYGGLDIFECDITSVGLSKPRNLGLPLNSKLDDFAYIVDENTQKGYVSSNRPGGKGDDDIYSFQRLSTCTQTAVGTVVNEINGMPEEGVSVKLLDSSGTVLDSTLTLTDGGYSFYTPINCRTLYKVTASKERYNNVSKDFTSSSIPDDINRIPLSIKNVLIVKEDGLLKIKIGLIFFDFDKWDITPLAEIELNKVVLLMMEYPEMEIKIESHTDSRGNDEYNLNLSDKRAETTRNYIISQGIEANRVVSAIGYGETRLINNCSNGVICSEAEHDKNRRSEFIILKTH